MPVKSAMNVVRNVEGREGMQNNRKRTFNLASAGLLVEALGVARLDDVQRAVDEDLDEADVRLLVQLARELAVGDVRRDEGCDGDARGVCEELRDLADRGVRVSWGCKGRERERADLADAADVLGARLLVEAEVLVQSEADVVAVKTVRELLEVQQVLLERARDRRLKWF